MSRTSIFLAAFLASACSTGPTYRYEAAYRVGESRRDLSAANAERETITSFDATTLAMVDLEPKDRPRLIRAPQPVMSTQDIDAGVSGEVEVEIWFNEAGTMERMVVLRSAKESLTEAVRVAVSQWQIVPPRRSGKASVLAARRVFVFRSER
jgi:TonB family protein